MTVKTIPVTLTRSELEALSHEELLQLARNAKKLEAASKKKKLEQYLETAHSGQLEFHKDEHRIRFILAGNRCVHGDTKIWTIDGLKKMRDITQPTFVLSMGPSGLTLQRCSAAIPKGVESLCQVSLGQSRLLASEFHEISCAPGRYQSLGSFERETQSVPCVTGYEAFSFLLKTISEHVLSVSLSGVLRLRQKAASFLDRYLAYSRRRDPQPQSEASISRASPPSGDDVQGCGQNFALSLLLHEDVLAAPLRAHSRPGQQLGHLSSPDALHHSVGPAFFEEDQTQAESPAHTWPYIQAAPQSAERTTFRQTLSLSLQLTSSFFFSWKKYIPVIVKGNSCEAEVFDLQVQGTHNYICENGLVHHNSGKSTAGVAELAWACMGTHPFRKCRTPLKTAVVLQDFENHGKNIFQPKMEEWVPPGAIVSIEKHQGGAWKRITWNTGSTTDIFSHDQDMKVFEGSDYDLVWFDEPPPRPIWNAMWRACTDRGGIMYMTGTPLTSPWLYQEWQKIKDNNDPLRWWIKFDSDINAKNLGDGDEKLGLKRLDEFTSFFSKEEAEARRRGDFVQLQGLVFKDWIRSTHVINEFEIPHYWPIYESIDPHPQKPWAVTYTALAPNGAKILLRSYYFDGTIDDIANAVILAREELPIKDELPAKITKTLIDNAASVPLWQKSNTDPTARRLSVREELENLIGPRGAGGPPIECAPKNVQGKIDLFKRWLTIRERGESKRADFFAFQNDDNEDFFTEIESYVWDKFRSKHRDGEVKNSPVKKNDDLLDTVLQVALVLKDRSREEDLDVVDLTGGFRGYGRARKNSEDFRD